MTDDKSSQMATEVCSVPGTVAACEEALAPYIKLMRLCAEAALLRRMNAGYGFADSRTPAEVYLEDDAARERLARDSLRPQLTHAAQAAELAVAIADAERQVEEAEALESSRLGLLRRRFDLDEAEFSLITVSTAYALDRDVRELCHALAWRRPLALYIDTCFDIVQKNIPIPQILAALHPRAKLLAFGLLEIVSGLNIASGRRAVAAAGNSMMGAAGRLDDGCEIARFVLDWMLGDERLAPPLDYAVKIFCPPNGAETRAPQWIEALSLSGGELHGPLSPAAATAVLTDTWPVVVHLRGSAGSGKGALARYWAAKLGRSLMTIPVPELIEAEAAGIGNGLIVHALAQARLRGAMAYLPGVEALIADTDLAVGGDIAAGTFPSAARWPAVQLARAAAVAALGQVPDMLLLGSRSDEPFALPIDRPLQVWQMPAATMAVRQMAWRYGLAGISLADEMVDEWAEDFASRYVLGPGAIDEVIAEVQSSEAMHASESARADHIIRRHIEAAIERRLVLRLGPLATRITRRARIDDMVLPEEVRDGIEQMIAMVRSRAQILEHWGYGRHLGIGRGVAALFSGESGTGKTMAASAISSALGLDLFRIDLAAVTSKWVGETEKHLARIFDEAQRAHAMLLFDEADSLFGKRTELKSAQDRYANLEVNYVLQRMENFEGVSVLTTNAESAIDTAFLRRLNFRLRFPVPEAEERALLWQQLLPPGTSLQGKVDVQRLAERFVMTGGHIRNALVRAAVLAAREGRSMIERDLWVGAHQEYVELGKVMSSSLFGENDGVR